MDTEKLIVTIADTGYDLEHHVFDLLKTNGWQVISNRYYIDDTKNIEREIDIVAYKSYSDANKVLYYTVLIISCKKAKEGLWAFLTRKKEGKDPNAEPFIVENHSTDKRLAYMIQFSNQLIKEKLLKNDSVLSIFESEHIPFAFQQVNYKSYKTEDDKKIYESIITTIKALEYEKANRRRPKIDGIDNYFYNYNLISIFDGDMFDIHYEGVEKRAHEISEIKYINRHIIGGKEAFYRVHFITKNDLPNQIAIYDNLHICNKQLYPSLIGAFYQDIFSDNRKVQLYWKQFCKEINWRLNYSLIRELNYATEYRADEYSYDYGADILTIHFHGYYDIEDPNFLEIVNNHAALKKEIADCLLRLFQYRGPFTLDNNALPF